MIPEFYPLKCSSLLKEKLWGGHELRNFLNKTSSLKKYGESWEVASLPEGNSSIANGAYRGKLLSEMIAAFAKAILGEDVVARFGAEMPLLIKFIDASRKLSVQLHPDDTLAQEIHKKARGKTEMWYILKAKKDAYIIAGFKGAMNSDTFQEAIASGTIEEKLKIIPVQAGDAFYIEAGLIHAIGDGIVLAEIQQTSDITYRVHDYNRKQEDGSYRELHLEEAYKAIKFELPEVALHYNQHQMGVQVLKHSSFFKTDIVQLLDSGHIIDRTSSFTVLIGVEGEGTIHCGEERYSISQGETYLIPADCPVISIKSQELKILEVYM